MAASKIMSLFKKKSQPVLSTPSSTGDDGYESSSPTRSPGGGASTTGSPVNSPKEGPVENLLEKNIGRKNDTASIRGELQDSLRIGSAPILNVGVVSNSPPTLVYTGASTTPRPSPTCTLSTTTLDVSMDLMQSSSNMSLMQTGSSQFLSPGSIPHTASPLEMASGISPSTSFLNEQGASTGEQPVQAQTVFDGSKIKHVEDLRVMRTLGTGAFGRVVLCTPREAPNAYFALKILKKVIVVHRKQVEHVNSERACLAKVQFPFIVNMVSSFQDTDHLYMLMDYVPGGELFFHLRRARRFTTAVARFYAAEIVLALEYLHNMGIVYRDLKPENLLLDAGGHVRITDFGFAKSVEGVHMTYTMCGTPEYLAPEILSGAGYGIPADWWALGILIYEMLAGYPPFQLHDTGNPMALYTKINSGHFTFPKHFESIARDLVKRFLVRDRTRRLGNLRNGVGDVKNHLFFAGTEWEKVVKREVRPPIVPQVSHPGDTRNFDFYPDESEDDDFLAFYSSDEINEGMFPGF